MLEIDYQVSEDVALIHTIGGSPERLIKTMEKFIEAGCRHFIWGL